MLYFILNSTSKTGYGMRVWKKIRDELIENEIVHKVYMTKYAGHAKKLAKHISSLPDDDICLVVVGGDGTVNEVLNGIRDFGRIRFAVIANGSGNDFGRGMKLPKDPVDNLRGILKAAGAGADGYTGIDLGCATWEDGEKKRLFAISAGMGLDAIVCKKALTSRLKKGLNFLHLGKLTYLILTVYSLFTMDTAGMELTLESTDGGMRKVEREKLIFMAVMNQYAEGGGVPMAPTASCTDGLLSFTCAAGIPKWKAFFLLPFLVAGKQEHLREFDMADAGKATLKLSKPMVLHTDGEYCGETDEITFTCLPGMIRYLRLNNFR